MQIIVENLSGMRLLIEVEPTDRVEDVKAVIQRKLNIPAQKQHLHFAGKSLEDGYTLQDCFIEQDSTLYLIVHTPCPCGRPNCGSAQVIVRKLTGEEIRVSVEYTDQLDKILEKAAAEAGIPENRIRVTLHQY
jgi:ubiquitin C